MIEIYEASTKNLKDLKSHYKCLKRAINRSILYNRTSDIETYTKLFAMLYSTFAEAAFIKMIHTPYGFNSDLISQIKMQKNLELKWKKCIELAFLELRNNSNLGEISNKKQTIERILNEYIIEPSKIRNKIAHGQWKIAFNNELTAINNNTTRLMNSLDYVKIDIYYNVYQMFAQLIEDLIESPKRAHYKFFYDDLEKINKYINRSRNWDFESRKDRILNTKKKRPTH